MDRDERQQFYAWLQFGLMPHGWMVVTYQYRCYSPPTNYWRPPDRKLTPVAGRS